MRKYLLIILCLTFFVGHAQKFEYVEVPSQYIRGKVFNINTFEDRSMYTELIDFLPNGFVRDASVDYTIYLQKGLNAHRYVLMPNFPIQINDSGLDISSNSKIVFQENSELILKPSSKGSYQMLRVNNKENVEILYAKLRGDKYTHLSNVGEWGMGISINGSSGVRIENAIIKNCWGDGIYVGHRNVASKDIIIQNCFIDNNRRNGISVISAENLIINNTTISNTNGTNPNTGLDIEPNSPLNSLKKIQIEKLITFNNLKNGMLIHLNKLPSSKRNTVSVSINDLFDEKSSRAIRISGSFQGNVKNTIPLDGFIKINGLKMKDNKYPSVFDKNKFFPTLVINK